MRILEISYTTVEYLWFPASIKMDGIDYVPVNPQINFAFVAPKITPGEDDFNNGYTGNIDYGFKGKPYFSFLFDGTILGPGRFDVWFRCIVLNESVKRKVAELHVK